MEEEIKVDYRHNARRVLTRSGHAIFVTARRVGGVLLDVSPRDPRSSLRLSNPNLVTSPC